MRLTSSILVALVLSVASPRTTWSQSHVEKHVVVGMYSGLALIMDVHHPATANGLAVIMVPGSGWQRPLAYNAPVLSESSWVPQVGTPLLARGYTLFVLNHRAAPRFQFPAPLEDVQRAVRFVRYHAEEYGIDPERIGAIGASSGGHLVHLLGVMDGLGDPQDPDPINQQSAKVQAVVAWYAPSELASIDTPGGARGNALLLGVGLLGAGPNSEEVRIYHEASPITYVSADDPPTLLVHGDADGIVNFEQSVLMNAALSDAGVATRFIPVPGGGHGARLADAPNPPDYVGASIDWIEQHLRR